MAVTVSGWTIENGCGTGVPDVKFSLVITSVSDVQAGQTKPAFQLYHHFSFPRTRTKCDSGFPSSMYRMMSSSELTAVSDVFALRCPLSLMVAYG